MASAQPPVAPREPLIAQVPVRDCPGGKGVAISTRIWTSKAYADDDAGFPALAAAMLPDGETLAVASAAPTSGSAVAAVFRSPCVLDTRFGRDGAVELTAPGGVNVRVVLPLADGHILVAGSTNEAYGYPDPRWLVGELEMDGRPNTRFGRDGWTLLPWKDSVTALAVTPRGDIVVAGDVFPPNGASLVSELDRSGHLRGSFGVRGRARMPVWHDGGVEGVWVEADGDILALVGGGNMGCWGTTAVTLTPSGVRVAGFTARFDQGLRQADAVPSSGFPFFVGDVVIGTNGFHLVGSSQSACWATAEPDPTLRISEIAFDFDGNLDPTFGTNGASHLPGLLAGGVWAFAQSAGGLLLAMSPADNGSAKNKRAEIAAYRVTDTGELDSNYGSNRTERIALPYTLDGDASTEAAPVPVSNGHGAGILTITRSGKAVILIRVPTN